MASLVSTDEFSTPGQPPSAQEIQRKLSSAQRKASRVPVVLRTWVVPFGSAHCDGPPLLGSHLGNSFSELCWGLAGKTRAPVPQGSGTDTEDEIATNFPNLGNDPTSASMAAATSPPLSAIAERTMSGAEESDDDEEDVAGGWRAAKNINHPSGLLANDGNMIVLNNGYLWKKGSGRRKTWKKRWFVLRPTHLACYKTSAEYKLLHRLDLSDVHAATPVQLKRHPNTCGIVTRARTFYLQAETAGEIDEWVSKINKAREGLSGNVPATPTVIPPPTEPNSPINAITSPSNISDLPDQAKQKPTPSISILVPTSPATRTAEPSSPTLVTPSAKVPRSAHMSNTSSDSDEGEGPGARLQKSSSPMRENVSKDMGKTILTGYLMKCGGRRKIWRKRWFVLTTTKLFYTGSHMDTKPHRQLLLNQILDAIEHRPAPSKIQGPSLNEATTHDNSTASTSRNGTSHNQNGSNSSQPPYPNDTPGVNYTFKVITPKKTLLLCAPSEEEEVKWISAVRALIARRTKEKDADTATIGGASIVKNKENDGDVGNALSAPSGSNIGGTASVSANGNKSMETGNAIGTNIIEQRKK
ncbi:hypothetical protein FRC17_004308 [Serendipita sp. 399]|nr:hypothetical protein FRC17_004308 [Serendipita sp. 399]